MENDPVLTRLLTGGTFRIEIEGIAAATFAACSGLEGAARFLCVQEGGTEAPRRFRAGVSWQPICLRRGFIASADLWRWFQSGEPRDGAIVLLAPDGAEAGRWIFERGRPSRWAAPELNSQEEGIPLELVEIMHEGMRWMNP